MGKRIIDALNPSQEEIVEKIRNARRFVVIADEKKIHVDDELWHVSYNQFMEITALNEEKRNLFIEAAEDYLNPARWTEFACKTGFTMEICEFSGAYADAGGFCPINHTLFTVTPDCEMEITKYLNLATLKKIAKASDWYIAHRNFSTTRDIYIKIEGMDVGIPGDEVFAYMELNTGVNAMFLSQIFQNIGNIDWKELAALTGKTIYPYNTHGQCWGHISAKYNPDRTVEDVPYEEENTLPYLP